MEIDKNFYVWKRGILLLEKLNNYFLFNIYIQTKQSQQFPLKNLTLSIIFTTGQHLHLKMIVYRYGKLFKKDKVYIRERKFCLIVDPL